MAAEKAAPLPVSAVFVSVEEKKQHAPADPPFPPGVRHVVIWAVVHAACAAYSIAYIFIATSIGRPPSWMLPRHVEVTRADVVAALVPVMIWCVFFVSQAAAGALALALPRHRLRLAYAALVATVAGHCMWAGVHYMIVFTADPGGLPSVWTGDLTALSVISCLGDFLCFGGLRREARGHLLDGM